MSSAPGPNARPYPNPHLPMQSPPPSQDPPDRHCEGWQQTRSREVVVESGLLLMALAKLLEHGAEASDSALLDSTERMALVLIPGALGSAASLFISLLGPTH